MGNIYDLDLKFHRQLSTNIIKELSDIKEKSEKNLSNKYEKLEKTNKELRDCDNIKKIKELSLRVETEKSEFLNDLSIFILIDNLCKKNENRLSYIDETFKSSGVYDKIIDKKTFKSKFAEINKIKISGDEEFTNPYLNSNYILFYKGIKYQIVSGEFDFLNEYNKELLKQSTEKVLNFAFKYFPKSISTISAEFLVDVDFKKTLLKKIASYVYDKCNKQPIRVINQNLGNLLNFSISITQSLREYIFEVDNLFNVMIVNRLLALNLDNYDLISDNLKCNFDSKFL